LSGFEAISKETILALEIEVVEGGTELQKEKRVGWQKQNSNN
jgi:exonuclease SbcC